MEFTFGSSVSVDDNPLGFLAVGSLVEALQAFEEELLDSGGEREARALEPLAGEILKMILFISWSRPLILPLFPMHRRRTTQLRSTGFVILELGERSSIRRS